mmetsp:Transcript_20889/g.27468  ORF Transcript_20889/g.27468 Transcript_20889/m.27468 type:complete len:205 (-) Transcript_20889:48-662(-)
MVVVNSIIIVVETQQQIPHHLSVELEIHPHHLLVALLTHTNNSHLVVVAEPRRRHRLEIPRSHSRPHHLVVVAMAMAMVVKRVLVNSFYRAPVAMEPTANFHMIQVVVVVVLIMAQVNRIRLGAIVDSEAIPIHPPIHLVEEEGALVETISRHLLGVAVGLEEEATAHSLIRLVAVETIGQSAGSLRKEHVAMEIIVNFHIKPN